MKDKDIIGKVRYHGDNFSFLQDNTEYEVCNIKPPYLEILNDSEIVRFDMFLPHTDKRPIKYGNWEITEDLTGILTKELDEFRIGRVRYFGKSFVGLTHQKVYNVVAINPPYLIVNDNTGYEIRYYIDHPGPNCNPLGYGSWIIVEDLYHILRGRMLEKYHLQDSDNSLYKYYKFVNGKIFRVSQGEETFQVIDDDNEWVNDDMISLIYKTLEYYEITDLDTLNKLMSLKEKERKQK